MSDKIIKEDDNFIWYEIQCDKGYVVSKNAYFNLQPERSKPLKAREDFVKHDYMLETPKAL